MELAEAQNAAETPAEAPAVEAAPVVETTPQPAVTTAPVREEKVELVSGDGLKIVSFSKSSGNFSAVGKIAGIRFFGKNEKLVRRLFG